MHAAPVQRTILSTRRIMVPPLTLCAYMKKGPNLRWSLIQCSGGDEGNRTPDLLTASQTRSQLRQRPVLETFSMIQQFVIHCHNYFFRACPTGSRAVGLARPRIYRGSSRFPLLFKSRRSSDRTVTPRRDYSASASSFFSSASSAFSASSVLSSASASASSTGASPFSAFS